MKKVLLILLLLLALPVLAAAEVHYIADETGLPEDWDQRETLAMTVVDTTVPTRFCCAAAGRR